MTGDVPYHELPEEEVKAQYPKSEFPQTKLLGPIRDVITQCWHGQYTSFDAFILDIKGMYAPDDNWLVANDFIIYSYPTTRVSIAKSLHISPLKIRQLSKLQSLGFEQSCLEKY